MRKNSIVLAAGIFYPDVGGPAIHVRKIAERLSEDGFEVTVLAYGYTPEPNTFPFRVIRISRKHSKKMQWLLYLKNLLVQGWNAKLIYAFDPTAAGLPSAIVSALFRKPLILRIGGDPIWERIVEKNKRFIPIEEYYAQDLYLEDNPKLYKIIKFILKRVKVLVTYNQFFKDFYSKYFQVNSNKIRIVKNPVFKRPEAHLMPPTEPLLLFAGRFVSYKNLPLVLRAFKRIKEKLGKGKLLLIGHGPEEENLKQLVHELHIEDVVAFKKSLPQDELFKQIQHATVALGPALNEFNPNFILESLSFGLPVMLSRGHGLSVTLPEEFLFDPLKEDELVEKLIALLEPAKYQHAITTIAAIEMNQTWDMVTDFHLALVKELTNTA